MNNLMKNQPIPSNQNLHPHADLIGGAIYWCASALFTDFALIAAAKNAFDASGSFMSLALITGIGSSLHFGVRNIRDRRDIRKMFYNTSAAVLFGAGVGVITTASFHILPDDPVTVLQTPANVSIRRRVTQNRLKLHKTNPGQETVVQHNRIKEKNQSQPFLKISSN